MTQSIYRFYREPLRSNELYHHGIKGQRWGIRRFQNRDGTLTPAGKSRYDKEVERNTLALSKAKDERKKISSEVRNANGYSQYQKAYDKLNKANADVDYAKRQLKDSKTAVAMDRETGEKSKHRLKLEQKYIDAGYSKQEAEIRAYRRANTERIIAIGAVAATVAVGAVVAKKQYDYRKDITLKGGIAINSIAARKDFAGDAFYGTIKESDSKRYRGLYANQLGGTGYNPVSIFERGLKATDNIKVASDHSAKKALKEMIDKDPAFKSYLEDKFNREAPQYGLHPLGKVVERAGNDLSKGKVTKAVYEAFNGDLVDHSPEHQKYIDKFYSTLKSKGYDALNDVNDRKYSGYGTKKPIIFIDRGKMSIDKVRQVHVDEITKETTNFYKNRAQKEIAKAFGATLAKSGAYVGAIAGASTAGQRITDNKYVEQYRKEHPNSTLSYNQIIRNRNANL